MDTTHTSSLPHQAALRNTYIKYILNLKMQIFTCLMFSVFFQGKSILASMQSLATFISPVVLLIDIVHVSVKLYFYSVLFWYWYHFYFCSTKENTFS